MLHLQLGPRFAIARWCHVCNLDLASNSLESVMPPILIGRVWWSRQNLPGQVWWYQVNLPPPPPRPVTNRHPPIHLLKKTNAWWYRWLQVGGNGWRWCRQERLTVIIRLTADKFLDDYDPTIEDDVQRIRNRNFFQTCYLPHDQVK